MPAHHPLHRLRRQVQRHNGQPARAHDRSALGRPACSEEGESGEPGEYGLSVASMRTAVAHKVSYQQVEALLLATCC